MVYTAKATSIVCPHCGNWCHLEFDEDDNFVICPNTSEIIDITDGQRFKYTFKFDEFLCELQKSGRLKEEKVCGKTSLLLVRQVIKKING